MSRAWLIAILLALLAALLRAVPAPRLIADTEQRAAGAPQLLLTDARTCLELRATEVALGQHELLLVDRALFHPLGDVQRDSPGLAGGLALAFQRTDWRLDSAEPGTASALEWSAVVLPPCFGALGVLAMFVLVALFAPPSAACFAALLAALWTPEASAGVLHPGAPATVLALFGVASFVWGARSRSDFDRVLGSVFSGGAFGVACLLSLSVWPILLGGHAWLATRAARARGVAARDLHRAAVLHLLACSLVLLLPARASPWNVAFPGTLQALSTAWIASLLGLGAGHAVALFLFRRGIEERELVRGLLPFAGVLGMLAVDGALPALANGVLPPSAQVVAAVFPVLALRIRANWGRAAVVLLVLAGSFALAPRLAGADDVQLLATLRDLRGAEGQRGAWPAAGAAHPSAVFAREHAALVPFHARRAVLPGVFDASVLDTSQHQWLRTRLLEVAAGAAGELRDQRLAAFGASCAIERDAQGRWSARPLPALAPGVPALNVPK